MPSLSRRDFLKLGSGSLAFGVKPSSLAATTPKIGIVGVGKQGSQLLNQLLTMPQIPIKGICDVSQPALDRADEVMQIAGRLQPILTQDYRELLNDDALEAIVIATPDFSHTPLALAALEAGKHVYLETPLTRTTQEFDHLLQVAEANGCILYADDGVEAHPGYAVAAHFVQTGLLGKISRINIVVNLPTPEPVPNFIENQINWDQFLLYLSPRPFDAALLSRWQDMRECSNGTAVAKLSQMLKVVHRVMQVVQPTNIISHGGVYVWQDGRNTPDTFHAILEYAQEFVVTFSMYPGSSEKDAFTLYGTQGTLDLLNWQITTSNIIKSPISDSLVQHANEQLNRATQHYRPHTADFIGWLNAIQRGHISPAVVERWSQSVRLSQLVAETVYSR